MSYHVIGLDLGACTVKAVILERSFRGYEVKETRSVPVPQDGSGPPFREAILAAAAELVEEFDPGAVSYVVGFPGRKASTWFLPLPFSDQRRISQTLPFELEDYVPFDLDEMILDYHVVSSSGGQSRVLAALARRDEVGSLLQQLKNLRVDPQTLQHEGYALAYAHPGREGADQSIAVVDIGHTQTQVTIRRGVQVDFLRSIPLGSLMITQALMKEFGVNYRTAELIKARREVVEPLPDDPLPDGLNVHDSGPDAGLEETTVSEQAPLLANLRPPEEEPERFTSEDSGWFGVDDIEATAEEWEMHDTGVDDSGDDPTVLSADEPTVVSMNPMLEESEPLPAARVQTLEAIEEVLETAQQSLVREVRNALMSYEGVEQHEVSAVLLTGGGALMKGLPEYLSEKWGVDVGLPRCLGPDQARVEPEGELARFALPFTLAYLGATGGKNGDINFRQGTYGYHKSYKTVQRLLLASAALVFVGILIGTGLFLSRLGELAQHSTALDEQVAQTISEGFPDITVDVSRGIDRPMALMLEEHLRLQEHGKALGLGVPRSRCLAVLQQISAMVPPRDEVTLNVDDYSYEADQVKIRGTTDSFEAIQKTERAIGECELVHSVDSSEGSKGDKKSFDFIITLKPADELPEG